MAVVSYCEARYCTARTEKPRICVSCNAVLCGIHGDYKELKDRIMEVCPVCDGTGTKKDA